MARLKNTPAKLRVRAWGLFFTAVLGLLLLALPDTRLQELSFDLPFCFRPDQRATNAVIIYFNQSCLNAAFQPDGILHQLPFTPPLRTNSPPDRRIYVALLKMLKNAHARLVFFDCNFNLPRPGEDGAFAGAIRENGTVILGGIYDNSFIQQYGDEFGIKGKPILPPNSTLREAVTNWGILALKPSPGDRVARQLFTTDGQTNTAIFLAAKSCGFPGDPATERWINYYGPEGSIDSILLPDALREENAGRFRGRAVFIGGDDPMEPDLHPTPYSRIGSPGGEILATSYLNLVQSDWQEKLDVFWQAILMAGWGVVATAFLLCFRPRNVLFLTPILMLLAIAAGVYTQWEYHLWWSWAIPAFVQTPVAGICAAAVNRWSPWPPVAFIAYRRKRDGGAGYTQGIKEALERRGRASVIDVDIDASGEYTENFRKNINDVIDHLPNFIVVLTSNSLRKEDFIHLDDELVREIKYAILKKRRIIVVTINDCTMLPPSDWPDDIREVPLITTVEWQHSDPSTASKKIIANLRHRSFLGRLWCKL